MINISDNFTLNEVVRSQKATRLGIDNVPQDWQTIFNISRSAELMEKIRSLLGDRSIVPSSWHRCLRLNRELRSKDTSAHISGLAVDFDCDAYGTPEEIVKAICDSGIEFDKIIEEFGEWVHIEAAPIGKKARREVWKAVRNNKGETDYIRIK